MTYKGLEALQGEAREKAVISGEIHVIIDNKNDWKGRKVIHIDRVPYECKGGYRIQSVLFPRRRI